MMSIEYQVMMANQYFQNEIPKEYQYHLDEAVEIRKKGGYESGKTEKLKIQQDDKIIGLLYLSTGVLKIAIPLGCIALLSVSKKESEKWVTDGKCFINLKIIKGEMVGIPDAKAYRAIKGSPDYFEID